jgi:outer membrane protein
MNKKLSIEGADKMCRKLKMIVCSVLIMFFLVIFAGSADAQKKPKKFTIQSAIAKAMTNSYSLKARKEQLNQATNVKNQARSDLLPKFRLNYGYTRLDEARTFRSTLMGGGGADIAISSKNNYRLVGNFTQPLFTGFGLISTYKLAKLGIDKSGMNIELEKLDLALQVKTAYFNVLIADAGIDVASKSVESLESAANVSRNFHKVGMVPINEVLQAEVDLANSVQVLTRAKNGAKLARAVFNTVLVRGVNEPVELEAISDFAPEIGDFEEFRNLALKNRPEIKLIDINLLQADQQINLAKSKYWPEVALNYNYIKEGDTLEVDGSPFHDPRSWEALISAQWTFWEWGKTINSQREKESFKRELMEAKNTLVDNITLEVKQAILDLATAVENIPSTQKAVEQGEENLRVNEERYKAQVSTILDLLTAQTLLVQARVNRINALYTHALAKATLDRAIGIY